MIASSNLKDKVWHYQVSGKQSFNGLRTSLVGKSAESLSFLKKSISFSLHFKLETSAAKKCYLKLNTKFIPISSKPLHMIAINGLK
jgi:hypothetical protein